MMDLSIRTATSNRVQGMTELCLNLIICNGYLDLPRLGEDVIQKIKIPIERFKIENDLPRTLNEEAYSLNANLFLMYLQSTQDIAYNPGATQNKCFIDI